MTREEIRVAIVEDEALIANLTRNNLTDLGYTVAWIAGNFESAVSQLNLQDYDIVLLDIDLNGSNSGIEIGKLIRNFYKKPFIFITSNTAPETIAEAVNAYPAAYIVKPFHPSGLVGAIQIAIANFTEAKTPTSANNRRPDYFFVKSGKKYLKIDWKNVAYLRASENYTNIFNIADRNTYALRSSLSKTIGFLLPDDLKNAFIQINRAEAIRPSDILEFNNNEIKTAYGTFTITDGFIENLMSKMVFIQ